MFAARKTENNEGVLNDTIYSTRPTWNGFSSTQSVHTAQQHSAIPMSMFYQFH